MSVDTRDTDQKSDKKRSEASRLSSSHSQQDANI